MSGQRRLADPHDELDFLVRLAMGDRCWLEECDARSDERQAQQEHRDDYREEMNDGEALR